MLIEGETSPWFHASCPLGSLTHELPHLADPLLSQKSGFANSANVPVRFGSPVTMCKMFISTGSARYLVTITPCPVARSVAVSPAAARSIARTGEAERAGCPCT